MNLFRPIVLTIAKVLTIIICIFTILSAYGGNIDPRNFATPALLCLVMPYVALCCVISTILWAFARNIVFSVMGVVTLIVCIPSMSIIFPLGYEREQTEGSEKFSIISWNVLHARDIRIPDFPGNRALEYMINSRADIICLTELFDFAPGEVRNATPELIDSLHRAYPFRAGLSTSDIKVISKYPVDMMEYSHFDSSGRHRFHFFKVHFPGARTLIVAMVHLYSYGLSEQEREVVTEIKSVNTAEKSMKEFKGSIMGKMKDAFRKRAQNAGTLREVLDEIPEDAPLIVCGDFNDVPASWAYNLIKGADMRDAYVETNFGPAFTYNLHKFYFHIDQMLYRGRLRALDLKIGSIDTSDHYPLIGEFEFTK